jgi:hypothetical protein
MADEETRAAVGACAGWKVRLRDASDTRTSSLSAAELREDGRCELSGLLPDEPSRILHRQFHAVAAEILDLALAGNRNAALEEMAPGTRFTMSLRALGRALGERQLK